MIYLKNVNSGEIIASKSFGASFQTSDWVECTEVEKNNYLSQKLYSDKITDIKKVAASKILNTYPEWRQRNHMAAVIDIQNKELVAIKAGQTYNPTADEIEIIQTAQTAKAEVFAIRQKSDELENSLNSMTQAELEAFDPTNDNNWI